MGELVRYSEACRALAEAKAVDEVLEVKNQADALKLYARQAKNKQLEVDAAKTRFRAERRIGEMMASQPKAKGGQPYQSTGVGKPPIEKPITLADPQENFDSIIDDWQSRVDREAERVTLNLLREGERAQRTERQYVDPPVGKFSLLYADPPVTFLGDESVV